MDVALSLIVLVACIAFAQMLLIAERAYFVSLFRASRAALGASMNPRRRVRQDQGSMRGAQRTQGTQRAPRLPRTQRARQAQRAQGPVDATAQFQEELQHTVSQSNVDTTEGTVEPECTAVSAAA